jgi:hypothetical protein
VLVWEDASDVTWLSYNDPSWLATRHGLPHGTDAVAGALAATLGAIVKMAAGQQVLCNGEPAKHLPGTLYLPVENVFGETRCTTKLTVAIKAISPGGDC